MVVHVADLSASILSNTRNVTDWATRYFGSWWKALTTPAAPCVDITVTADVNSDQFRALTTQVDSRRHETVLYARKPLRLTHIEGEGIIGYEQEGVGYRVDSPTNITIVGIDPDVVASASCRLAREALRGQLARNGWLLMHASAAVAPTGEALIALGNKGAGKTSTVLQLARACSWSVLANDRLFARVNTGAVELLPWPAATAIGLGLLDALGWFDVAAAAHESLHSSTPSSVHEALVRGQRVPLFSDGREAKVQVFPDQITSLFRLPLAGSAVAAGLLFPSIAPDAVPRIAGVGRELTEKDTFVGETEDRYPNVWGLAFPAAASVHQAVFHSLNRLPRHALTLSHNITANADLLRKLPNLSFA
jgi:hypothetical protein